MDLSWTSCILLSLYHCMSPKMNDHRVKDKMCQIQDKRKVENYEVPIQALHQIASLHFACQICLPPICVRCLGLPCVNTISFHSLFTRLPHECLGVTQSSMKGNVNICKFTACRKSLLSHFLQRRGRFIFALCFPDREANAPLPWFLFCS